MDNKLNLIIVEDEAIIAQFLRMEMEIAGYSVIGIYSNGKDCLEAVKNRDTDVVLMDINLNGSLDGIDTAIEIQKYKQVSIIFMSGFSEKLTRGRAMKLLPAAFLSKPIVIEDLLPVLEKLHN